MLKFAPKIYDMKKDEYTLDILSPLKEVRFLDANVAAMPSYDGM